MGTRLDIQIRCMLALVFTGTRTHKGWAFRADSNSFGKLLGKSIEGNGKIEYDGSI